MNTDGGQYWCDSPYSSSARCPAGAFRPPAARSIRGGRPASQQDAILTRIRPPSFPKRDFDITKYGAKGDGKTDCTKAIRQAIAACTKAGGGRVVVPRGRFLTGAVHLEDNVNLYIGEGATLAFSQDPAQYLPLVFTRFEGTECMNYSPFIYAFEKTNIGITGPGTLDGQADCGHWWNWVGTRRVRRWSGQAQRECRGPQAGDRHGRQGRAGERPRLRARTLSAPQFHSALPLHQRD